METIIAYRENSDHARDVSSFLRDFSHQTGKEIKSIDVDSAEGLEFCRLYDITAYPTMISRRGDGSEVARWAGLPLPTISEVSYYVQDESKRIIQK